MALFLSFYGWAIFYCVLRMHIRMYVHYMYTHAHLFPTINGHLGCFYLLAIVNSAAMNIGMHVSFQGKHFDSPREEVLWLFTRKVLRPT